MLKGLKELFVCSRDGGWCWQSREPFEPEEMADHLWHDFCDDEPSLPRTISVPSCSCSEECSEMENPVTGEDDDLDSVLGILLPMPEEEEEDDDYDCFKAVPKLSTTQTMSTSTGSRDACVSMNEDDEDGYDSVLDGRAPEMSHMSPTRSAPRTAHGKTNSPASLSKAFYEPGRNLAMRLLHNRVFPKSATLPPVPKPSVYCRTKTTLTLRSNQAAFLRNRTQSDSLVYSVDDIDEYNCCSCDEDDGTMEPCRLGALPNTSLAYHGGGVPSDAFYGTHVIGGSIHDSSYNSRGHRWTSKEMLTGNPLDAKCSMHRKTCSTMTEETSSVVSFTSSCQSV
jgi:hypothetical protein